MKYRFDNEPADLVRRSSPDLLESSIRTSGFVSWWLTTNPATQNYDRHI